MTHPLGICLWFDHQAKQAADFYQSVFPGFKSLSENPLAVNYTLYGRRLMHLNGGPGYTINPSISFFIETHDAEELQQIWEKLSEGGKVMMAMNSYPWSPKYGWCSDQYGVNWQLMLTERNDIAVIPSMMFTHHNNGKAYEAIKYYTSIFSNSSIEAISKYEKGEPDTEGNIKYSRFYLHEMAFSAMESSMPHAFTFNEAVSYMITVDTQEEIDFYWNHFLEGGQAGRCGWIKDKYGVSWQIVPSILGKLMTNPETAPKATYAFLQMSKFIISDLEKATAS
jgi:predicted 3-demethylubiquinone-9 3-methyltransferase (glyoxalase superfamily)